MDGTAQSSLSSAPSCCKLGRLTHTVDARLALKKVNFSLLLWSGHELADIF